MRYYRQHSGDSGGMWIVLIIVLLLLSSGIAWFLFNKPQVASVPIQPPAPIGTPGTPDQSPAPALIGTPWTPGPSPSPGPLGTPWTPGPSPSPGPIGTPLTPGPSPSPSIICPPIVPKGCPPSATDDWCEYEKYIPIGSKGANFLSPGTFPDFAVGTRADVDQFLAHVNSKPDIYIIYPSELNTLRSAVTSMKATQDAISCHGQCS